MSVSSTCSKITYEYQLMWKGERKVLQRENREERKNEEEKVNNQKREKNKKI